jgi:hypothetical protein
VREETFVNYRGYRWLWINLLVLAAMIVLYVKDHPVGGRNGGTVLGYTYGGLATAGILYLMWYGIRKRSYHAKQTTLKGWLAAHIWLGISLSIIVPLHAGFSFGLNVHTLAYALMVTVILSGIWGALNYDKLASRIESHRGGGKVEGVLEQIAVLSADIESLSLKKSDQFLKLAQRLDFEFRPSLTMAFFGRGVKVVEKSLASKLLMELPEGEREEALRLIGLIDKKSDIAVRLMDEVRVKTLLRLWLYIHLPVSFGLLMALAIHIFSVFYYW